MQKEVDALTEQVNAYTGNSRQEKQYMYLDEMLTRELIKLDDIETEGKDNVRMARKQAIKSIQDSISLLESKAPLPGQQQEQVKPQEESAEAKQQEDNKADEKKEPEASVQGEQKTTDAVAATEVSWSSVWASFSLVVWIDHLTSLTFFRLRKQKRKCFR